MLITAAFVEQPVQDGRDDAVAAEQLNPCRATARPELTVTVLVATRAINA